MSTVQKRKRTCESPPPPAGTVSAVELDVPNVVAAEDISVVVPAVVVAFVPLAVVVVVASVVVMFSARVVSVVLIAVARVLAGVEPTGAVEVVAIAVAFDVDIAN